jgi:hypothetical protein
MSRLHVILSLSYFYVVIDLISWQIIDKYEETNDLVCRFGFLCV